VPQYLITDARLLHVGERWEVRARVKNVGTGVMPVEIAATRGERYPKKRDADNAWRDARATLVLAAGEDKPVTITCGFEPQKLVVDPDVTVLMLERQKAEMKLRAARAQESLARR
jgi:ABC-2 type transport system permease protein